MPAQIPPWLDISPQQFTQASTEGLRLGQAAKSEQDQYVQGEEGLQNQRQGQANQLAEALGAQHLQAENQAAQQAEEKARLNLELQSAAKKAQAQATYQQAIQGGMDPVTAMMQFGPLMGESLAGLGTIANSQQRMRQAAAPPQPIMGPDGKVAGYTYGGQLKFMPKATVPKALSDADKLLANHYLSEIKDVEKATTENASIPVGAGTAPTISGNARSLKARKDEAIEGLKRLGLDIDGTAEESKPDNASQKQAPKKGDVQDGYEFLGGDPADQKNWQKIFSQ